MKVRFRCPDCRAKVKAPDRYIGRSISCPRCGSRFIATVVPSGKRHKLAHAERRTVVRPADWYCIVLGQELGPMALDDVLSLAREGHLSGRDLVRKGATGPWQTAAAVPGIDFPRAPASDASAMEAPATEAVPRLTNWRPIAIAVSALAIASVAVLFFSSRHKDDDSVASAPPSRAVKTASEEPHPPKGPEAEAPATPPPADAAASSSNAEQRKVYLQTRQAEYNKLAAVGAALVVKAHQINEKIAGLNKSMEELMTQADALRIEWLAVVDPFGAVSQRDLKRETAAFSEWIALDAENDFRSAVGLDPNDAEALLNWSLFESSCPVARYRNAKSAIEHARKACTLTKDRDWSALSALAAAHAENGEIDQAIELAVQRLGLGRRVLAERGNASGAERADRGPMGPALIVPHKASTQPRTPPACLAGEGVGRLRPYPRTGGQAGRLHHNTGSGMDPRGAHAAALSGVHRASRHAARGGVVYITDCVSCTYLCPTPRGAPFGKTAKAQRAAPLRGASSPFVGVLGKGAGRR